MNKTLILMALFGGVIISAGIPANALYIGWAARNDFDDFYDHEISIIEKAIRDWDVLFPCSDGFMIAIEFYCDITLSDPDPNTNEPGPIGEATITGWENGRPRYAVIYVDNDDLTWSAGPPDPSGLDAYTLLSHEIAHALGFTVGGDNFANNVVVDSGGNRFYDINDNGQFDNTDYDLIDNADYGTHSPDGSGDLMERIQPRGVRQGPTPELVHVLHDAYRYCIPEPCSLMILFALGSSTLLFRRLRRG